MLYMSCTLCIYRSIGNKQRFHRPLQSLSTHIVLWLSIIAVTRRRVAQTFESTTVGIMDSWRLAVQWGWVVPLSEVAISPNFRCIAFIRCRRALRCS